MSKRVRKPDDPFTELQLLDLARALSRQPEIKVELGKIPVLDWTGKRLVVAERKDIADRQDRFRAQLGDVLIFGYAAYQWGDIPGVLRTLQMPYTGRYPRFYRQMVSMLELVRLERLCIEHRRGSRSLLEVRRAMLVASMRSACLLHARRREWAEAWVLVAYLHLWQEAPPFIEQAGFSEDDYQNWMQTWLPRMLDWVERADNLHLQAEVATYCQVWETRFSQDYRETYFDWLLRDPTGQQTPEALLGAGDGQDGGGGSSSSGETRRPDKRMRDDSSEGGSGDDQSTISKPREQQEASKTHHDIVNKNEAVTNEAASGATEQTEGWEGRWNKQKGRSGQGARSGGSMMIAPGEVNRFARAVVVPIVTPTAKEELAYAQINDRIYAYRKGIQRTIMMTLDRQRTGARDDLLMGRLGRRLVRAVIDEQPRLFYKKTEPINRLDCSFHLLVDCSASMYDKMEETKLGIALFHESLRALQIHHAVTGFWEDSRHVVEEDYPNCFQTVIDYGNSLREGSGPAMMQLHPQQDNRDGFAIRWAARRLHKRPERQRILLVFSDGEPAAAGYHGAGLLDSRQAVLQTRKMGMEVIGIYLATRPIKDSERQMMQYIYGRSAILVPNVEQLPSHLAPVLKKLLLGHTQSSQGMGRV